ncbi:hypothetical protein DFH09DRAFT_1101500 [Mycena vulgaris]|nr:hypothetical protein DFH09DRAFT_1101500 [Mycena vulgaris]
MYADWDPASPQAIRRECAARCGRPDWVHRGNKSIDRNANTSGRYTPERWTSSNERKKDRNRGLTDIGEQKEKWKRTGFNASGGVSSVEERQNQGMSEGRISRRRQEKGGVLCGDGRGDDRRRCCSGGDTDGFALLMVFVQGLSRGMSRKTLSSVVDSEPEKSGFNVDLRGVASRRARRRSIKQAYAARLKDHVETGMTHDGCQESD